MDFFASQDDARRKTGLLVIYFALAVILIIVAIYAVLAVAFLGFSRGDGHPAWWNTDLFLGSTLVTLAIVSLGSLYKIQALSSGGRTVAESMGGRLVDPDSRDAAERRLLNVVEEMALASGVPVPPVYVMDAEPAINAFAAGFAPSDAVVAVTRGTIESLSRDELQGVIAHEFSHILRGDMRLNIRLMGVLHGILVISIIGWIVFRMTAGASSSRSDDNGGRRGANALPLVGLAIYIIGYVGVFFGHLIKSAVSRQREYLADASAVQFTRQPDGLAGALKKIGGLVAGSRIQRAQVEAEEASHMFFSNALSAAWFSLLATHPPLEERIRRIDPQFAGEFPRVARTRMPEETPAATAGFAAAAPHVQSPAPSEPLPLRPAQVTEHVGTPQSAHVEYAGALLKSLPITVAQAVRNAHGARLVVLALLLDDNDSVRSQQLRLLSDEDSAEVQSLASEVGGLGPTAGLPLVELALPALRYMSSDQFARFEQTIQGFVAADQRMSVFEYALQRMLLRHLAPQFRGVRASRVNYYALSAVESEAAALLSVLAYAGQNDDAAADAAFAAGMRECFGKPPADRILAREAARLRTLDRALTEIAQASPAVKERVLAGCAATIAFDTRMTVAEGELLRAVADALDCPMPPLLVPAGAPSPTSLF